MFFFTSVLNILIESCKKSEGSVEEGSLRAVVQMKQQSEIASALVRGVGAHRHSGVLVDGRDTAREAG